MLAGEEAHELPLGHVRVLELVDEDVAEAVAPAVEHVGVVAEEPHDEEQQVVEVGGRGLGEAALVLDVDLGDAHLGLGERLRLRLFRLDQLVLERRDRVVQPAGREPLRVQVQVAPHVVDEAHGVGLVVDRERAPVAEHRGLAPQDPRARGVERRHPHPARDRADERADALLHLARGLVGERDREQLERGDPALGDQVRDAVGEQPGLARTRAGDDEDRVRRAR